MEDGGFVNVKVNVNDSSVAGGWWRVTRNEPLATRNGMGFPRRRKGAKGFIMVCGRRGLRPYRALKFL